MAEFVHVGLVYTRLRPDLTPPVAKLTTRVYIGPDNENAQAAFTACQILRDSFEMNGVSGPNHCSIAAILPFKVPVSQLP